ncbi:hypothetical protein ASD66_16695 [Nocardioides sp. Root151]|nr:hypothetical protein ASD30_14275 [Nocardioides sp. Root140]KQZ68888.1 hypothetical protein ASD66_16695 [Nocardioides sp. Root151]KRF20435.1 hypothetical protein ASH02_22290 [Nocardioides sp. Soil796]
MAGMTMAALVLMGGCDDDDQVTATPEALAAVALEHTGIEPTLVEGSTEDGDIGASIEFDNGHQRLGVGVKEDPGSGDEPCDDRGTCTTISTDAGDVQLYWEDEEPEEDPGLVIVTFASDEGVNVAYYAGDSITADPRDLDLGVDVDDMVAIVTDERFGTTTTTELTEVDVPGWAEEPTERTPQTIAHHLTTVHQTQHRMAAFEVDAGEYGEGSIGATVELEDGITITGYYVPDAERAKVCPSGWTCTPGQDGEMLEGHPRNQVDDFSEPVALKYRLVFLSDDGSATIVVRDGIPLAGWDPRDSMDHVARNLGRVDGVEAEDLVEINEIWEQR